ncbi:iron ABC transporter ATP-binding protein [Leifsonia shinshuensis]|uniref:iron ABC transporter ATP-binding protein n=1 Tax=Leifsonia shinshuensis TaxID=150026 RepID=UPI001F511971|nr:iron ABC transporter ATP-binding protein [Leifsonia shinshuensis]MCI0158520.1 iron ABC transporter ATP-binding protein [Leifsonia shinshuensis]
MQQHTARTLAALAIAAAAVTLVGCTPTAKPASTPSASATAGGAAASNTPAATPTPTPTLPPTPVTLTCDQVVTADQLYAYNPNFSADPGYAPKAGSLEKQIADWKGVTCAWQNQTSGDVVQIAVAHPPADQLESLKNAAITAAQPVPTYGTPPQVEGYFKAGDTGQVQIFRGPYWIVAESTAFFEPGDAAPLMQSVLGNLPTN